MAESPTADRIARWNERYARGEETFAFVPSILLPEAIADLQPGLALDLACGAGRHSFCLAERGWRVTAVDGSSVAIDILRKEAARRDLGDRIDARVADLMSSPRGFVIEEGAYELICDFFFLDRTLFEEIERGVRPGGRFVAAIHVSDGEQSGPRLLQKGELRRVAEAWGWEIERYEEDPSHEVGHKHGTARLIARRPRS
jgi:SAM-dependent methyltransferase